MAVKLFMSSVRPISTYDKMLLCEQAPTQHFVICVCMAERLRKIEMPGNYTAAGILYRMAEVMAGKDGESGIGTWYNVNSVNIIPCAYRFLRLPQKAGR